MLKTYKITFFDRHKKKDIAYVEALTANDAIDLVKKNFRVYLINGWKEMKGKYDKFTKRTVRKTSKLPELSKISLKLALAKEASKS